MTHYTGHPSNHPYFQTGNQTANPFVVPDPVNQDNAPTAGDSESSEEDIIDLTDGDPLDPCTPHRMTHQTEIMVKDIFHALHTRLGVLERNLGKM